MKKNLLVFAAMCTFLFSANAQQRFVLYEEFTGENCGPCALYNPGLLSLMMAGSNPSKILMIKYMSAIPSAGTLYYQNSGQTEGRISYYSISSAPQGRMDGITTINDGHPLYMSQSIIDAEAAIASPFNMTINSVYTSDRDSVIATVTVTAVTAFAPSNATMKLRVALLGTLHYAAPPGTNGETDFENVVRKMYPDEVGTTLPGAWTAGETHTYTVSGPVPPYVDTMQFPTMTAWVQNDADKKIAQAAIALPPLDVAAEKIALAPGVYCTGGSTTSITPTVSIYNAGKSLLTSATVYYKIDNGTWQSTPWTGSLAANTSATVALPATSITGVGNHILYDSVGMPNGQRDQNTGNSNASGAFTVISTTPTTLPTGTDFENGVPLPTNWVFYDANSNGKNWSLAYNTTAVPAGHNGSVYAAMHYNTSFDAGETNYILLPTANAKAINFYTAYAQRTATSSDALDVVYSTDCGQNWTSLWSKAGAALATGAMNNTTIFVPSQSEWKYYSVDVTSAPAGSMLAFKGTSGNGNELWLDDINISPWPAGVANVSANAENASINVYPNPARDNATVSVILDKTSNVKIDVLDAIGGVVTTIANESANAGMQKYTIATSAMAAGLYHVRVQTDNGTITQQLSVTK